MMRKDKQKKCSNSGNVINEIFAEIDTIIKVCTEVSYSETYGFSPQGWFNIGRFKQRLNKLKKKYEKKCEGEEEGK